MLHLGFCAAFLLLLHPQLRLLAPVGPEQQDRAAGSRAGTPAAIARVKEKASHLFSAGSGRSSSRHPGPPAARTWRRAPHRCGTASLSALTGTRNLSSWQHARGSLGFVWVWKIWKHTPFSFSFEPAAGVGFQRDLSEIAPVPFPSGFPGRLNKLNPTSVQVSPGCL